MNDPKLPSNQKFGILFIVIFAAIAGVSYWKHGISTYVIVFCTSAFILLLFTLFNPSLLYPLNKAWFLLGQLLGRIVSPVVLGIIFFVLLTPISLIARLIGRDELHLKRKACSSYWVARIPPGPTSDSFKNQF
jgi:hypothetical protein